MKNAYAEIATANRYDAARSLPAETKALWLDALRLSIPEQSIRSVLDLGCGTGRFTSALGETFACPVTGVEPSAAMIEIARSRGESNIEWRQGAAEAIPLKDETVDLVFMSQVFHHFAEPGKALQEIRRVLKPGGYLAIRNGTREHNGELVWLNFFPEAGAIEQQRTPSAKEIEELVCCRWFVKISHRVIRQLFASSAVEYYEKISQRALSALVVISDEAFQPGLKQFKIWMNAQPAQAGMYEPVDLFIFQKVSE